MSQSDGSPHRWGPPHPKEEEEVQPAAAKGPAVEGAGARSVNSVQRCLNFALPHTPPSSDTGEWWEGRATSVHTSVPARPISEGAAPCPYWFAPCPNLKKKKKLIIIIFFFFFDFYEI